MKLQGKGPFLAFGALVLVMLALAVGFTDNNLRVRLLGIELRYKPVAQAKNKLQLQLQIKEGREVQGQASQAPIEATETSQLAAEIEESVQGVSATDYDLIYRLTKLASEQFAWRQEKSSKLLDERWEAHVGAQGPLLDCKPTGENRSPWLQPQNLEGWLSALWISLPRDRTRPLDGWSAEVQVPLKTREMREPIILQQRFNYRLSKVFEQDGLPLATVEWTGTMSALAPAVGEGQLRGAVAVDMQHMQVVQAEFSLDQQVHAPIPGLPGGTEDGVVFAWHQTQVGIVSRPK